MTFINERISRDDIKKYNLEALWIKVNPIYKQNSSLLSSKESQWVIDRDRDIFVMPLRQLGGAEYYGSEWVIHWKGENIFPVLKESNKGSMSFDEQPYRIVWELIDINLKKYNNDAAEIIQCLKDALSVYGLDGITRQIPNTMVSFEF